MKNSLLCSEYQKDDKIYNVLDGEVIVFQIILPVIDDWMVAATVTFGNIGSYWWHFS